jgi:hypothetical protein
LILSTAPLKTPPTLIPRKFIAFLVLITICLALLNTATFGPETFAAFFFFTIAASITSVVTQLILYRQKKLADLSYPIPFILFSIFCLYIFLHGLFTDTIGIFHYYWIICGLFLLSLYGWGKTLPVIKSKDRKLVYDNTSLQFLHSGISIIKFEKIVVTVNKSTKDINLLKL